MRRCLALILTHRVRWFASTSQVAGYTQNVQHNLQSIAPGLASGGKAPLDEDHRARGRGLYSSTFQLNLSRS